MKVDCDLYYDKDSYSVNKGHNLEINESVSIFLSHDYTTTWIVRMALNAKSNRNKIKSQFVLRVLRNRKLLLYNSISKVDSVTFYNPRRTIIFGVSA